MGTRRVLLAGGFLDANVQLRAADETSTTTARSSLIFT